MNKQPKFSVGQKVRTKPTLHGETTGVITEIHRILAELDSDGTFKRGGLHSDENEIPHMILPHRWDGTTLEVDFPQHDFGGWIQKAFTMKSKFYGYSYTVKSATMLTQFSERSIKAI